MLHEIVEANKFPTAMFGATVFASRVNPFEVNNQRGFFGKLS
jgi:hypothetical protein